MGTYAYIVYLFNPLRNTGFYGILVADCIAIPFSPENNIANFIYTYILLYDIYSFVVEVFDVGSIFARKLRKILQKGEKSAKVLDKSKRQLLTQLYNIGSAMKSGFSVISSVSKFIYVFLHYAKNIKI